MLKQPPWGVRWGDVVLWKGAGASTRGSAATTAVPCAGNRPSSWREQTVGCE